jgi:hypothetical protein
MRVKRGFLICEDVEGTSPGVFVFADGFVVDKKGCAKRPEFGSVSVSVRHPWDPRTVGIE